ncbi:MAG: hypothetical protein GXC78_10400 [Chitinophagaceae bacterium]|nr:hypothetical protein [Chitinophagaceae bacterium]
MMVEQVSIFFHSYYGKNRDWLLYLNALRGQTDRLYYNVVRSSYYQIGESGDGMGVKHTIDYMPGTNLIWQRSSTDQGKDIGGKLILIDVALKTNDKADYWLFAHDKKSPHHEMGQEWAENSRRLLQKEFIEQAKRVFRDDASVSVVCQKEFIREETDDRYITFFTHHHDQDLRSHFSDLKVGMPYAAGTMFLAKAEGLRLFFQKNPALTIRGRLEKGDVMDNNMVTETHAWERGFSWILLCQGGNIKGV